MSKHRPLEFSALDDSASISIETLPPGAAVLLMVDQDISVEQAENVIAQVRQSLPGHECAVFSGGIRLLASTDDYGAILEAVLTARQTSTARQQDSATIPADAADAEAHT